MTVMHFSNKDQTFEITPENGIAFRRLLGYEPKNRITVKVQIEAELLEASGYVPRSGELSDLVNLGLNMVLIQTGKL